MSYLQIMAKVTSVLIGLVALGWLIHTSTATPAPQRSAEQDRQALITLENDWLKHEHDAAALERILAPDFVHPVATGDFLDKGQHIHYSSKHPPRGNLKQRFDNLTVRVYGDVGIVNGIVVTSDERNTDIDRTIFTDVFVFRDGRWQAINAQETKMEKL